MKKNLVIFKKVVIFYAIYGVMYNIISFIFFNSDVEQNSNAIGWLALPILLILCYGGIYIVAFVYGFILQRKIQLNDISILISMIIVFVIGIITYYFYSKINLVIMFSGLQAISFFAGVEISRMILFLEKKEKDFLNK